MSRLFVELYLDEDVSVLVGTLLRSRGVGARTTGEAGNLGNSDVEQMEFASRNQLAILTHNRVDFERLAEEYRKSGKNHSGIVIAVRRSPYEMEGDY